MQYLIQNFSSIMALLGQTIQLVVLSLAISLLIAFPLGIMISRIHWMHPLVIGVFGVIYTIPSLSLLVLLIPLFGLGTVPAVVALVAYTQFILLSNWSLGLALVDAAIIEAANGLGMNPWQRFWQVEFPLALPYLLSGIRLAVITTIGIGTVAAFINAGGVGKLLFEGVITGNNGKILAGSIVLSAFAVAANSLLRFLEKRAENRVRGSAAS
jgi:osmoprotectant transport system permease protein